MSDTQKCTPHKTEVNKKNVGSRKQISTSYISNYTFQITSVMKSHRVFGWIFLEQVISRLHFLRIEPFGKFLAGLFLNIIPHFLP